MRIRFLRTAAVELDRALTYVHEQDPAAAKRMAHAIASALDWIARWPEASRELSGTDIRTTLVPRYQYRIFYKVIGDEVVVRNIRSTRQLRPGERGRTG